MPTHPSVGILDRLNPLAAAGVGETAFSAGAVGIVAIGGVVALPVAGVEHYRFFIIVKSNSPPPASHTQLGRLEIVSIIPTPLDAIGAVVGVTTSPVNTGF